MKDIIPENAIVLTSRGETRRKLRWPQRNHCAICKSSIWFHSVALKEPAGAPEPRQVWVLCQSCHQALLTEMRRSPVRSSLRLRIALGIVASERSPQAYGGSTHLRDQRRFLGIAWVLFIAMIIHLLIIVILATTH